MIYKIIFDWKRKSYLY